MNLGVLARVGLGAARYRLTGWRMPLTAFVSVTNRCSSLCGYCNLPLRSQRELSTDELVDLVDQLAAGGCQCLVLTGGEPLERPDIDVVTARAAGRGLWVRLETNGHAYPALADDLEIHHLVVGLDGCPDTHDAVREPGAHAKAVAALAAAQERGIERSTVTVLTRYNLAAIDAILDLAEAGDHLATFRLLDHHPTLDPGLAADLAPDPPDLRRALRRLLDARRAGRPVGMTQKTLRTLVSWHDYADLTSTLPLEDQLCVAGQTHVYVDTDGMVYPCRQLVGSGHESRDDLGRSVRDAGFTEAFRQLGCQDCQACAVADLTEQNHLHSLNVPALLGCAENWRRERGTARTVK